MLKKLFVAAIATITVSIQATPIYLTFEGTINQCNSTSTITAPSMGAATVVLKVDPDAAGYRQDLGDPPIKVYYDDFQEANYNYNYYLADVVSSPTFIGSSENPYGVPSAEYHLGLDYFGSDWHETTINVSPIDQNSSYNLFELYSGTNLSSPFEIGANFGAQGRAWDSGPKSASWYGNFTLTNVTPQCVPEPSGVALLFFSLIGFAGLGKLPRNKA